jgi:hypothetical protein
MGDLRLTEAMKLHYEFVHSRSDFGTISMADALIRSGSNLVQSLLEQPLHPVYYPYSQFTVIHATRVALVWASLTKKRSSGRNVTFLHDLVGYLTMCCESVSIWQGTCLDCADFRQGADLRYSPYCSPSRHHG